VPPSVATGAVRSYRTLSPLPSSRLPATLRRFAFCCTFRGLAPPRRYLAPHPPEPGLSSPPIKAYASMEAAIAQPTSQGIVGFFIGKKSANAAFFGHYSGRRRQKAWFLPPAGTRSYARAADFYKALGAPLATGLATQCRLRWRDAGPARTPRSGAHRSVVQPARRRGSAAAP
jgi:hypothetical protein